MSYEYTDWNDLGATELYDNSEEEEMTQPGSKKFVTEEDLVAKAEAITEEDLYQMGFRPSAKTIEVPLLVGTDQYRMANNSARRLREDWIDAQEAKEERAGKVLFGLACVAIVTVAGLLSWAAVYVVRAIYSAVLG